jgi:hypothetical protein
MGKAVAPIQKVDTAPATATLRNFMIARLFFSSWLNCILDRDSDVKRRENVIL